MLKTNPDGEMAGKPEKSASQLQTHSPASFPLRLPRSMRVQATELAKAEGISLNQFVAIAIAEKLARIESSSALNNLFDQSGDTTSAGRGK